MMDRIYRINAQVLENDRQALTALQRLNDYTAVNQAYSINALTTLDQVLEQAKQNEIYAQNALAAARDATINAEWALHDAMLGAKSQVLAQYGPDSDAIQSMGLKKKSKRRRGTLRAAKSS